MLWQMSALPHLPHSARCKETASVAGMSSAAAQAPKWLLPVVLHMHHQHPSTSGVATAAALQQGVFLHSQLIMGMQSV